MTMELRLTAGEESYTRALEMNFPFSAPKEGLNQAVVWGRVG